MIAWSWSNEVDEVATGFPRVFVLRGRGVHGLHPVHPAGVVEAAAQLAGGGGVGGGL